MRDLVKHIGSPLALQVSRLHKQLSQVQQTLTHQKAQGKSSNTQQAELTRLQTQLSLLQATQERYHHLLHQLSLSIHPFAIEDSGFQGAIAVIDSVQQHLQALKELAHSAHLPKLPQALDKFSCQAREMAAGVNAWWSWVLHSLTTQAVNPQVSNWLLCCLLPVVYWQQQVDKTKTPALKQAYRCALAQAQLAYTHDPS